MRLRAVYPNNPLAMRAATAMRQWKRELRDKRRPKAAEKPTSAPAAIGRKLPRPAPTLAVVPSGAGYAVKDEAGNILGECASHAGAWAILDRHDAAAGRDEDRRLRIGTAFAERGA